MAVPKTSRANKSRATRRMILKGAAAMMVGIFLIVLAGLTSDDIANRAVLMIGLVSLVGGCATTVIVSYFAAASHEDKGAVADDEDDYCDKINVSVSRHNHGDDM